MASNPEVQIDYTNWKGFRSIRRIIPKNLWFGTSKWHREPQWLLDAHDIEKNAERTFAMKDINSWRVPGDTESLPSLLDACGISKGNPESASAVRKLRDEWDEPDKGDVSGDTSNCQDSPINAKSNS